MGSPDILILSCAAVGLIVAVVLSALDVEFLVFCSGCHSATIEVPSATGVFFWRPCCLLASLLLLAPAVAGVHTVDNFPFANGICTDFGVAAVVQDLIQQSSAMLVTIPPGFRTHVLLTRS